MPNRRHIFLKAVEHMQNLAATVLSGKWKLFRSSRWVTTMLPVGPTTGSGSCSTLPSATLSTSLAEPSSDSVCSCASAGTLSLAAGAGLHAGDCTLPVVLERDDSEPLSASAPPGPLSSLALSSWRAASSARCTSRSSELVQVASSAFRPEIFLSMPRSWR